MAHLGKGLIAAALIAAAASAPAQADAVSDFYTGKRVNFIIASGAGGGYDSYGRMLARHWGNHIPGKPSIISRNMPGAAGLQMTNYMYNKGKRDGSSAGDYTVNPATGLPFMTGPAGAGPVNHVLPAWDIATGLSAVNGLLAAERRRRETGEGQLVEVALSDVAFAMMGALGFIGEAAVNGVARGQGGNDLFGAFGRDFETADGRRVMVVGLTGRQWQALKQATGLQAEITALAARLGLDLEQEGDRYRAGAGIAALLEPWCRARSHAEVARVFTEAGVAWSTYRTLPEALAEDPRCSADGPLFTTLEQPGMGSFPVPGSPVDFSGEARLPPVRAPRLGEHTDQVLAEVLGLSSHRIGELHDAGLVAGPD